MDSRHACRISGVSTARAGLFLGRLSVLLSCGLLVGCAAVTNPAVTAIPVRRLPEELLGKSKTDEATIPLPLLGQKTPDAYRLAPGDVLGIWIEGVLGERSVQLPVHIAPAVQVLGQRRLAPALGYPVPLREDGTISLPLVDPLRIQGLTVQEAQEVIRQLYAKKGILKAGNERVLVSLLQERQYHIVVVRQEAAGFTPGPEGLVLSGKRGTAQPIDLPANQNDVLHALSVTGGLPGLDAYNEIVIQRACFQGVTDREVLLKQFEKNPPEPNGLKAIAFGTQIVRIPLRVHPGESLPFGPADVILQNGDVIFLEARDKDLFYTAGLLPAGEHVLPRDKDLDVIEAIAQVRGPLVNGAFATNTLAGNLIQAGLGDDSPSLLTVIRRLPGGEQIPIRVDLNRAFRDPRERLLVQAGDVLVLQEKPGDALGRYLSKTVFNFSLAWEAIHTPFGIGVIDVAAPERIPGRIGVGTTTNR